MDARVSSVAPGRAGLARPRWLELAWRYGLSSFGPMAIAGAHFVASILLLRTLEPDDFGRFSFVFIVVPLCLSMSGALLGAPVAGALNKGRTIEAATMGTYLKSNLAFSAVAAIATALLLFASRTNLADAVALGIYSGAMTARWFARSLAYARGRQVVSVLSDVAYSCVLLGALAVLMGLGLLTLHTAAFGLVAASLCGLAMFGRDHLLAQAATWNSGSLKAYWPVWRDLTRWSLAGVVLSELTSNAHAYFVTFISGPKAFALLAAGALMMRPVSLVLTALPDMERPAMARKIAQGDVRGAFRIVNEFRTAAVAMWLATILLGAAVLVFAPHFLIKPGYDAHSVVEVFGFWVLIAGVRMLRTPNSVFLQAAQDFSSLARAGARACAVSLIATPVLLFVAGPIASLGGILLGDAVVTANIFAITRRWKRSHA